MSDGDSVNKPFLFPNTIFHLNDKVDFDEWMIYLIYHLSTVLLIFT